MRQPKDTTERRVQPIVPVPLTFGSLFAGIGGFDLGFERAGMVCKWQVEINEYSRRILAKHWPSVRQHDDVATWPRPDTEAVDVVCGGFPCQDISLAGLGAGLSGERSGLWFEYARIIGNLRPRFVVVENVSALLARGLDRVLGSLANLGYDAEWDVVSACAMAAPHMRKRMFLVAYPSGSMGKEGLRFREYGTPAAVQSGDTITAQVLRMESTHRDRGVPNGISARVDERFRGLGNAVVPQIAEWIGRRIVAAANDVI
jgi:DNA (cytosine-5)-methyltransferase 1